MKTCRKKPVCFNIGRTDRKGQEPKIIEISMRITMMYQTNNKKRGRQ